MSAADKADNSPDNPVAVLLEQAVKDIREKAAAATKGPWKAETFTDEENPEGLEHFVASEAVVVAGTGTGPAGRQAAADAAHIASWHPGQALSVAGLLEREAERATLSMTWDAGWPAGYEWWCSACDDPWGVPGGCGCWDTALAVARTWLGEVPVR